MVRRGLKVELGHICSHISRTDVISEYGEMYE